MSLKSPKELFDIPEKVSESKLRNSKGILNRNTLYKSDLLEGDKRSKQLSISRKKLKESEEYFNVLSESAQSSLNKQYYNIFEEFSQFIEKYDQPEDRGVEDKFHSLDNDISDVKSTIDEESLTIRYSIEESVENINSKIEYNQNLTESEIRLIKSIQEDIQRQIEDIPNQRSRFDPSNILRSLRDLKSSMKSDVVNLDKNVNEKIDNLPEIRHYEDDLDRLQDFITEVRNSIRYYDSDVSTLKNEILDMGNHIGKTINYKIGGLKRSIQESEKRVQSKIPEVKYYDSEIDLIENKIDNLFQSIRELPEVKYYDQEIINMDESIRRIDEKVNNIDIPDWSDVIRNIQDDVNKMQKLQEEWDKRWEEAAIKKDGKSPDEMHPDNVGQFVTFDDMQKHYRKFLERVQIQLGSVGGGGAVEIMEMDDIDPQFRTNPQNYDQNYLQHIYDPTTKTSSFIASPIDLSGGGITGRLNDLDDVDTSGVQDGYLMIYQQSTNSYIFVSPQQVGINVDANPDILIDDYGTYT